MTLNNNNKYFKVQYNWRWNIIYIRSIRSFDIRINLFQSESIGCNNDARDGGGKKVNKTISLPDINLFTNRSRDLTITVWSYYVYSNKITAYPRIVKVVIDNEW